MSKVIIQECKDYSLDNLILKLNDGLDKLGGWSEFVHHGDTVLLKINLIGPKTPESAAVTHCELTRALVKILKSKGCNVWIGDSSGGAIAGIAPTVQSFKVAGFEKIAIEEDILIKNFDSEGVVEVHPKSKYNDKMYLAKPIFDADVVINLPKLKTHSAAIYTGALKNVFGCIPGLRKAKYHKDAPNQGDFGEIIADIHEAAKFHLHIMDGIISMQGEGPTAGDVYQAYKLIISKDPVALDVVAMNMLGMDVQDVPIVDTAIKRGIGIGNLDDILIDGDYRTIPKLQNYKLPKKFRSTKKRNSAAVIKVIDFLKTRPVVNMKKCKNCNMCVESCPVEAINKDSKKIDYKECIECMCCHELCIHKAVDLKKDNAFAGLITRIGGSKYK